jgi:hypothetical protein
VSVMDFLVVFERLLRDICAVQAPAHVFGRAVAFLDEWRSVMLSVCLCSSICLYGVSLRVRQPLRRELLELLVEWVAHFSLSLLYGRTYLLTFLVVRAVSARGQSRRALSLLTLLLVSELFPFAVELACLSDVGTGAANGLLAALEMRDSNSDMGKCGLSPMDTGLQSLVEVTGAPSVLFLLAEVAKKTLQVSTFGVSVLAALYLVVRRIFPF